MHESSRRAASRTILPALLFIGLVLGTSLVVWVVVTNSRTSTSVPAVNGTLSVRPTPVWNESPSFWGVNVRADGALGPAQAASLNQTPVRLVRWPGGALADRLDPLGAADSGRIFFDNGTWVPADTSLAQFVAWCRSVQCSSIVSVPLEVDNSSYATSLARYLVTTLGFTPTYWELGNEPARWSHFGLAWERWTLTQDLAPTAAQYATAATAYVTAIRGVEPAAKFLAPGGVGFGGVNETTWITTLAGQLGRSLSGISVHVYPAGNLAPGSPPGSLASTLTSAGGIPTRVEADREAAAAACPTCALPIFLDEFGSETGNSTVGLISGFPLSPYVAAELLQALQANVSSAELWLFQSGYPAAWFGPDGSARPTFGLYTSIFSNLSTQLMPTALQAPMPGVVAQAFRTATGAFSLIVTNANAGTALRLNLSLFEPVASVTRTYWDGSLATPARGPIASHVELLAPFSVARWDGLHFPLLLPLATPHRQVSGPPSSLSGPGPAVILAGVPSSAASFGLGRRAEHSTPTLMSAGGSMHPGAFRQGAYVSTMTFFVLMKSPR